MPNFELEAKANVWIFFGPMIVAALAAFLMAAGPSRAVAVISGMVGTWFILKSKFALKSRTHKALEWGTLGMTKAEKIRYYVGYFLLSVAIIFVVLNKTGITP